MEYTIGQMSAPFGLPVSTLRYYDRPRLFPYMQRVSGVRRFGEQELEALRVIECLKKSGLEIKDIKRFMEWCAQGSGIYPQRRALFQKPRAAAEAEIARMERVLDMLKYERSPVSLVVTGHSQGAALMQIFIAHLLQNGVLPQYVLGCGFASPCVAAARTLKNADYPIYHIVHADDAVPRIGGAMHLGLCRVMPDTPALRGL